MEFEEINKTARWDYQRERVYVRSNPALDRLAKKKQRTSCGGQTNSASQKPASSGSNHYQESEVLSFIPRIHFVLHVGTRGIVN